MFYLFFIFKKTDRFELYMLCYVAKIYNLREFKRTLDSDNFK